MNEENTLSKFEKMMILHNDIIKNRVLFKISSLTYKGTPMKVDEFHLPFKVMKIVLSKRYKIDDTDLSEVQIAKIGEVYKINLKECYKSLDVMLSALGEISIFVIDASKFKDISDPQKVLKDIYQDEKSKIEDYVPNAILDTEKHYYNFVYDLFATIDYLNHSDYIITKHTTTENDGEQERLPYGIIERRIKIRRLKKIYLEQEETHRVGSKHRYKYRVRGHFRAQENNKSIWIADHVRGGDGTIFIPKEYEF